MRTLNKKPDLKPRLMELETGYVNKLLGLELEGVEIKKLLERMRFGVENLGQGKLDVKIPAYRADILHPMDLVEDVAIAYDYSRFKPEIPKISTIGVEAGGEIFYSGVRELMIGFGFQEVMTLIMTNVNDLFKKMNLPLEPVVETRNPVSLNHAIVRSWLLPSLTSILERNKNREYPQKIFETGLCIDPSGEDCMKLAGVVAHSKTNYSEIKSLAAGFLDNVGVDYEIESFEHGSFIGGRVASTAYGFFGELHPAVLENHGLEVPLTAIEFNLDALFSMKN
ncbi:MAG: hypothetical protein B6U72_01540 [Candidatus Altiarchaeales archaeon ex4484_2]|nr:MAG: hypothetical protein B6U72_01540 [Candidatus Altiarchaeales archaeon ex4484_2]